MSDCGGEPDVPVPDPWATDRLTPQLMIRIPVSEEVLSDVGNVDLLADEVARMAADLARAWVIEQVKAIADRKDAEAREPNPYNDARYRPASEQSFPDCTAESSTIIGFG